MSERRTSLRGPGVERFLIECFAPSCHVDIAPVPELVTAAPRDTVDSIMGLFDGGGTVQDLGTATSRSSVQERQARHEQGAATTEGGLAP